MYKIVPGSEFIENEIKYTVSESGEVSAYKYIGKEKDITFVKETTRISGRFATQLLTKYDQMVINKVDFTDNIISMDDFVFSGNNLEEVILNDKCILLGKCAFEKNKIKTLDLNKVKRIGEGCFEENNIEVLLIPKTVTNIGKLAFAENNIKKLILLAEDLEELDTTAFIHNPIEEIYVTEKFAENFPHFCKVNKDKIHTLTLEDLIKQYTFKETHDIMKNYAGNISRS